MKTIITLLFVSSFYSVQGQILDYFSDNPRWLMHSACGYHYPCVELEDYVYYLNGDTLIQGNVYHKIYRRFYLKEMWFSSTPPSPGMCNVETSGNYLMAFVRQDNQQMRLWDGSFDVLLYDFDLTVGDTLPDTYNSNNEVLVVTSIDTLVLSGTNHRKFNLDGNGPSFLVEGIGHEYGFLERMPPSLECGYEIRCYEKSGQVDYPMPNNNCVWNASLGELPKMIDLEVFPNPTTSTITIVKPDNLVNAEVVLTDALGQRILLPQVQTIENLVLDAASLPFGVYTIQLWNGQQMHTARFVKE